MRSRRKKVGEFTLVKMYQDPSIKVKHICHTLNITPSNLYDRLNEMGIPKRQKSSIKKGNRLTAATIKKIYSLYSAGHTKYAISKKLSISVATVTYHLNKGIPAELYTPPTPTITATIVARPPSLWARFRNWFG